MSALTRRLSLRAVAASLIVAIAACSGGDNPTKTEDNGQETGQDTASQTTGQIQGHVLDDPTGSNSNNAGSFTGTLNGKIDVEVSQDGQSWHSLGAAASISLPLQDPEGRVEIAGNSEMPTGTYKHARVNLHDMSFVIDEGSVVNGDTLKSDVHMRLGDTGSGVAEPDLESYELKADATAHLVVEFNTETWLDAEHMEARQVPKKDVENNAGVRIVTAGG